jgi:hypothetical protein
MGTRLSHFIGRRFMRISTSYQVLRCFVKKNLLPKLANVETKVAIITLVLLAGSPQQGLCLTAEEIAYLKKAGVSDKTIQLMIEQENRERLHSETGIWETEDESGNRSTIYNVGDEGESLERERIEQEKVDRAWEMLRNLIIDAREKN